MITLGIVSVFLVTQIGSPDQREDQLQVTDRARALAAARMKAWNSRDWRSLAADFTAHAEMVAVDGKRRIGREAIEEHYRQRMKTEKLEHIATFKIEDVTLVTSTVATVDASWIIENDKKVHSEGTSLLILVKEGNEWRIASLRATHRSR
jgi:uncharacterized protein (TIGR02246 family)